MKITKSDINFKKLKRGEPDFMMNDGIQVVPRAAVEFSELCPGNLILQVQDAIGKGWIRPVAYIKESEFVWEKVQE